MRPYSDRDGRFYQFPVDFPVVLFDQGGYVLIQDANCMENDEKIRLYREKGKLVFLEGISRCLDTYRAHTDTRMSSRSRDLAIVYL